MTAHQRFYIYCDIVQCTVFYPTRHATSRAARAEARAHGWRRVVNDSGKQMDLCPACVRGWESTGIR